MIKTLVLLSLFVSGVARAEIYALLQGGYGQLNQKSAASNNVYPSGLAFAGGLGMRRNYFELEATIHKFNGAGDIEHDGEGNTFKHDQTSLLFACNFYLSRLFYLRLGYGFHRVDQTLEKSLSPASEEGARKAYGLKENVVSDGILYGGGVTLYESTDLMIYTQFENMNMSTLNANVWNVALGFKYFID